MGETLISPERMYISFKIFDFKVHHRLNKMLNIKAPKYILDPTFIHKWIGTVMNSYSTTLSVGFIEK